METILEKLGKVSITAEGVHNYNKRYKRLSLVTLTTGDRIFSFLSRKDVPVRTSILNTEYWMPVSFDATYKLQSDWNETGTSNPAHIRNKPTKLSQFTNDLVFRTINHETIKGEDNINIHDGFYFPNAVQDNEGNWYGAVVVGDQVWLGENIRVTKDNNGNNLTYYKQNNVDYKKFGYLYQWTDAVNVSPTGFHLPSWDEWLVLFNYVKSQQRHILGNDSSKYAHSLASTEYWSNSATAGSVGNDLTKNNTTGFNAYPGEYYDYRLSASFATGYFWSTTEDETTNKIKTLLIHNYDKSLSYSLHNKSNIYFSVRCVSNLTPVQFRDWYIKQYGSLQHRLQSDWAQTDNTAEDFIKNTPNFETELLYEEVTYSELTTLISNNNLVKNKKYRITDYVTTTTQTNTTSAGHQFDLIVTAVSDNQLDYKALAVIHDGDTYFSSNNADLSKWEIWYDINNDTTKYEWADTENGKGVIYRLIDEWGNDCAYDFKNILFTKTSVYSNVYTFDYNNADCSLNGNFCRHNIIKPNGIVKQSLPFNVFLNTYSPSRCYNNVLDYHSNDNIFKNYTTDNKFGTGFTKNTCNQSLVSNIFGDECHNNGIGMNFSNNTIKDNFSYNSTGTNFSDNNIDSYFLNNSVGTFFSSNVIGYDCHHNNIGNNFKFNILNNNCMYNTFVNDCTHNVLKTNCSYIQIGRSNNNYSNNKNIIIESDNHYISIYSAEVNTTPLQNIYIAHNCSGTEQQYTNISTIARNNAFRTTVGRDSQGNIRIYNEDDPVATPSAADVHALPDTTKYGASIELSFDDDYTAVDDPTGHNPASEGWYVRSGTSPNYVYTLTQDTTPVSGTTYYTAGTYIITATLKDQDGNTLGTQQVVDLPLESVVVDGHYDSNTKKVILVLKNGSEISFSVADLVSGLQSTLVSGTNIKTINGVSILGSGNLNTHNLVYAYENTQVGTSLSATIQENDFSISNLTMLQCYFGHNVPASATLTVYNNGSVTPIITSAALYRKGAAIGADAIKAGDYAILMYSSSQNAFVVTQVSSDNTKQDTLISGTNIKTINNASLLGSGNISIADVIRCTYTETDSTNHTGTMSMTIQELQDAIAANKVVILVRGDLVYTLTSKATISARFVCVQGNAVYVIAYHDDDTLWHYRSFSIQELLESGTTIKTINNTSILGSGNITINELPAVTSSDNGKILIVDNGAWAATTVPVADNTLF